MVINISKNFYKEAWRLQNCLDSPRTVLTFWDRAAWLLVLPVIHPVPASLFYGPTDADM